jgi:hypothetical protein
MTTRWEVLLPKGTDPSGPESITDFARCTGMDEYSLEAGRLGGAGLDTFEDEPPGEDHPLYARDDVILTPHVGGVTTEALGRVSRRAAANVRTVYEGGLRESTVNREALNGVVDR